jgi:hypothetical protein
MFGKKKVNRTHDVSKDIDNLREIAFQINKELNAQNLILDDIKNKLDTCKANLINLENH